jgi:phosphoribosylformylglycinamidine cyclo-ligase
LDISEVENPVLVSSVDGVGTKLKIAIESGIHHSVGEDLVNHCINDIAVCGAKPLYFMDYMAFGKLDPDVARDIISGFAKACRENEIALIGGETAEMPGLYDQSDYDLSGTIVGIVNKQQIIDGSSIGEGDLIIGFESNGLHTNGYSLARKVLLENYKLDQVVGELGCDLKTELLRVHKSYLNLIQKLLSSNHIKGFSHITGGGIIGNTKRIVPGNLKINIDWNSWKVPPIFELIKKIGGISDLEMRKVFNMGIGLAAVIDPQFKDEIYSLASEKGENAILIGKIVEE